MGHPFCSCEYFYVRPPTGNEEAIAGNSLVKMDPLIIKNIPQELLSISMAKCS